jgi:ClpP class serine protease
MPCAVGEGLAVNLPAKREQGYVVQPRASLAPPGRGATSPALGAGVALLRIRGVMTTEEELFSCGEAPNYPEIAERYCAALDDSGVGALVVDMRSAGGDVAGGEEGIDVMREARERSGKPVFGYVGSLAASMAVWVLSGICDAIYVHPSAWMGSIGVLIEHETDARKAADSGIDRTIIRWPPGKANPNMAEQLDPLGLSRLQERVRIPGERFVACVAAWRGVDPAEILAWDGAMFNGAEAVARKLANGTGALASTIALAAATIAATQEAA